MNNKWSTLSSIFAFLGLAIQLISSVVDSKANEEEIHNAVTAELEKYDLPKLQAPRKE